MNFVDIIMIPSPSILFLKSLQYSAYTIKITNKILGAKIRIHHPENVLNKNSVIISYLLNTRYFLHTPISERINHLIEDIA